MCHLKPKSALSTKSAHIFRKTSSVYNSQQDVKWSRRCQTALYKPHRKMMESCSYQVVRQMELEGHKSALNNAVLVLGIHRSKSEVDVLGVQTVQSEVTHGTSQNNLPRELSQVFISTNTQEIERERRTAGLNREETKIPTTTIPKKGLIKLTALNHEVQDPSYYEKQRDEEDDDLWIRKKPLGHISDPHKKLVKKTMLEHMKVGNRMLAEQEKLNQEQEKIEKELGECTIGDLQINLNKMTEELSKKKSEERIKILEKTKRAPLKRQRLQLVERSITLPSIKDFTFG